MRHYTQSGSGKQIPLAFNPMASLDSASELRRAYTRLELSRRLTFEQVMANRVYAIGVRNLADAIVRRATCGNSTKSTPTANAIAKDTDPWLGLRPEINCSGAEKGGR
jgi:hypothetical protein